MNSIEPSSSERLAAQAFDRIIVALASARRQSSAPAYFPLVPDKSSASYFSRPALPVMEAADFAFPGQGTAEGLVNAITAFWERSGDPALCALAPLMRQTASALQDEAVESDGTVSIFCYAMF